MFLLYFFQLSKEAVKFFVCHFYPYRLCTATAGAVIVVGTGAIVVTTAVVVTTIFSTY